MAILDDVKAALGLVDDHANAAVQLHIDTVKSYLEDAGIETEAIEGAKATGAIVRGVCDLWNAGSGGVSFSPVFYDLVTQLALTHQRKGED